MLLTTAWPILSNALMQSRFVSGYRDKYVSHCNSSRACFRKAYGVPIDLISEERLTLKELAITFLAMPVVRINEHFKPLTFGCIVDLFP